MDKINQDNIDNKLREDIEQFGDFKQETIEKTYDDLASKYENMMTTMGHPDPI